MSKTLEEFTETIDVDNLKISPDTIVRTVLMFVTLINAIGAMFGGNPLNIDQATLYQGLSAIVLTLSSIGSWWKNNSFTKAALLGDSVKDIAK